MDFNRLVKNLHDDDWRAKWVEEMPDNKLFILLKAFAQNPGPVIGSTRELYEQMMIGILNKCPPEAVAKCIDKYLATHDESREHWVAADADFIGSGDAHIDDKRKKGDTGFGIASIRSEAAEEVRSPPPKTALAAESTTPVSPRKMLMKRPASLTLDREMHIEPDPSSPYFPAASSITDSGTFDSLDSNDQYVIRKRTWEAGQTMSSPPPKFEPEEPQLVEQQERMAFIVPPPRRGNGFIIRVGLALLVVLMVIYVGLVIYYSYSEENEGDEFKSLGKL